MFDLTDKTALVTGGSSGIGLAVAQRFAAVGARVAVADLQSSAETGNHDLAFFQVDVSNSAAVSQMFEQATRKLGKLDIVVNNAGVAPETGKLDETRLDAADLTLNVNLRGVLYGLKFAPASMTDGGSIINTASLAASIAYPTYGPYTASKAGVVGLTQVAAVELGSRGIRVNAVCPGTILTPMQPEDDFEARSNALLSPFGRVGTTDDVVGLYHFLAADESRFITGQSINVDGGISAGISEHLIEWLLSAAEK